MKNIFTAFCISLFGILTVFAAPSVQTDLDAALEKAKTEKKMLFIQYGREACGNCQALKGYIKGGKVSLKDDKFVYVDLNCDDKKTSQLFSKHFKVNGKTLPFVVVADSDGKQLTSHTGYGKSQDFDKLIKDAEAKVKK